MTVWRECDDEYDECMISIGLTGGIGAGKSTVAKLLAEHGAHVIDADAIAREVTASGTTGHEEIARAFPDVVREGIVQRDLLARRVFSDRAALAALEGIVHPRVLEEATRRSGSAPVVIHEVPLIVEKNLTDRYDAVVVVGAPMEVRRQRLRTSRGMTDAEIDERIAAQVTDEQRRAAADYWIENAGSPSDLASAVAELWADLGAICSIEDC